MSHSVILTIHTPRPSTLFIPRSIRALVEKSMVSSRNPPTRSRKPSPVPRSLSIYKDCPGKPISPRPVPFGPPLLPLLLQRPQQVWSKSHVTGSNVVRRSRLGRVVYAYSWVRRSRARPKTRTFHFRLGTLTSDRSTPVKTPSLPSLTIHDPVTQEVTLNSRVLLPLL